MSQLETVLRRAIAGLDPSDRDGRRIALGNVRGSMVRLLAVYDPPLSAAEIEGKIDEVDRLIRAIEAGFSPAARPLAAEPESRFDSEYEAGDEIEADEQDPDEGPFDEIDGEADAGPEDARGDGVMEAVSRRPRALPVVLALLLLAALGAGLVYLAREIRLPATVTETAAPADAPAAEPAEQAPATEAPPAGSPASEPPATPPPAATPHAGPPAEPPAETPPPLETPATNPPPAASLEPGQSPPDAPLLPPQPGPPATEGSVAPREPAAAALPDAPVAPPPGPAAAESLIVFDGHDPAAFRSTPDNPVHFEGGTSGGFVQLSSSSSSNGARLLVGPGVYQRIAGRNVRIVVVARGAPGNPSSTLRLAYQNGRRLSGWSDQTLTGEYRSLAMNWSVPKDRAGPENDAVLLEPGIPGDQTATDIRSVTIDVLP